MKANSNRDGRLNFDALVDAYDLGRPELPTSLVADIAHQIGLRPGGRMLEIGAGTGQLTRALLDVGFRVVALEPGTHLADRLRSHVPQSSLLTIRREFFEDYAGSAGSFSAIWAANSFHWIAPDVSYRKAASLLDPSGHLILLWNFPILRHDLQCALNDNVFSSLCPNFLRNPNNYPERLVAETADGRQELRDSEQFEEPRYWITTDVLNFSVDSYLALLASYGHVAEMGSRERSHLLSQVRQVLGDNGVTEDVEVVNRCYVCIARKRSPAKA